MQKKSRNKRRGTIINISRKVFGHFGFSKTTMIDIAEALNIKKPLLYYYFKDKKDLFKEVIKKEVDIFSLQLKKAVDSVESPEDKLRVFSVERMRLILKLSNIYAIMKDNYIRHFDFVQEQKKLLENREAEILRSILKKGALLKVFDIEDIETLTEGIQLALRGMEQTSVLLEGYNAIKKKIEILLKVLLYGIKTRS